MIIETISADFIGDVTTIEGFERLENLEGFVPNLSLTENQKKLAGDRERERLDNKEIATLKEIKPVSPYRHRKSWNPKYWHLQNYDKNDGFDGHDM